MPRYEKIANILLGGFTFLFALMFFYVFFKGGAHQPGDLNKYYILSVAGFLFFAYVLFKCNIEIKIKVALLTLSLTASCYIIELLLSYAEVKKIEYIRDKSPDALGIPFDSRHRIQVWMDMRNDGIDAYPIYNPYHNMEFKESDILPLAFISGKTSIFCNEGGEHIIYKSDEYGFNNPQGLYNDKNMKYVLIGDSFTQGCCVKPEENIAGWLTKKRIKVLNLGIINSGPLYELAILKEYARYLRPRNVFWIFYEGNDYDMELEKKSSVLLKYLNKGFSQDLFQKQKLIDQTLITYMEKDFAEAKKNMWSITEKNRKAAFNLSASILKLSLLRKRLGMLLECSGSVDPLFKDVITEAKSTVDEWDGQLVFVFLPEWSRYSGKNYCRKRFLDTGKKQLLTVVKDLQIPVIDIQDAFDSHPDPLSLFPFRLHGHYNAKGYFLVAEQIEKYLSATREN